MAVAAQQGVVDCPGFGLGAMKSDDAMLQKPTFRLCMSEAKEDGRESVLASPDLEAMLDIKNFVEKRVQLHAGCHPSKWYVLPVESFEK